MDRTKYPCYVLVLCYLCVSAVHCKYLHARHLMQDAPDHDDGPLTDLSHSANNRQPGHDHVATGPDQTDQNLHNQLGDSASNGHDDLDTVHASDGHLVAHLQDGYHDVQGNDLDTAGPSNGDDNFNDYGSLDHMSLPDDGGDDDNGAIPDGAANTHDNTNAASHLGNNDNEHVQGASNNLGNSMDAGQMIDSLEHDTDNDMNQGTDDSVLDIHQPSNAIDHSDTDILDETIQNDDDYDTTDDYVIPDSAAHIHQDAVNTHDSTIGNHSDTSPSHSYGIIANHSDTSTDHHVNTIASHSDSLLDHLDSAIANHSDTSTDHCVSAIANHSDTLTDHLDSALGNRSDTSIDHQVSAKANHSDTSIDHQVSAIANHSDTSINHQVSAIANHSDTSIDHQVSAIANHSDTSIDHQVSAIANHSDTSIDHQVSAIANHSDTSIDHQVSAIANHSDTSIDHQVSAIANHSDTLTHHHDSAIPINPGDDTLPRDSDTLNNHNSLSAHITILPHNNGMVLDSHTAINDSFRIISNGGNENNAPVSDGNSQVGQHVEGSGNNPITNNNNNTVDHNTVHQIDHNTGLLLDSEFGHIDQPGSHDGHGAHSDGHNSGMDGHLNAPGTPGTVIVDPNSGSDHNAGVYIPDTDQIHEGSGSPPHSGTDQGTDPGHELGSGHHALPPSNNLPLPTSREGPEVHPDTVSGSGDGPGIDKNGGIHDLSHHGDHEPGHVEPARPRHTDVYPASTTTPPVAMTTVKVIILPTPVEPEIVDHSRTTQVPHGGEEIEGSGSEGHPVAMVTPRTTVTPPIVDHSRTTPGPHSGEEIEGSGIDGHPVAIVTSRTTHIGHDGQGHIVAVTTTTSGPDEGSGSGQTEHEGHPDEHLPGEGSGQDPEGHDGSTNTTAEKADKEPGKEEDLKNTTSVLPTGPPSEGQPSSNLVIVPTSSSSLRESMTENGLDYQSPMTSHQLTQVAVSTLLRSSFGDSLTTTGLVQTTSISSSMSSYSVSESLGLPTIEGTSRSLMSSSIVSSISSSVSDKSTTLATMSISTSSSESISPALTTFVLESVTPTTTSARESITHSTSTTSARESISPSRPHGSTTHMTHGPIQPTSSTTTPDYSVITQPAITTTGRTSSSPPSITSFSSNANSPGLSRTSTVSRSRFSTTLTPFISRNVSQRTTSSSRLSSVTLTFPRYPPTMTSSKTILVPATRNGTSPSAPSSSSSTTAPTASTRQVVSVTQPSSSLNHSNSVHISLREKSSLSPLLTTLLSTMKRKNISITALTTTTTTKKPDSPTTKGPDKPVMNMTTTSTASISTTVFTATQRPVDTERTTPNLIHEIKPSTTPAPSSPPTVFVQVELRMTWTEFCSKKVYFIADLREIIHIEKQVLVAEERFKISNLPPEFCRMVERNLLTSQIKIHVYIMNEEGGVDVSLTIDLSNVIEKGFRTLQSEFKDKFVRAQLFPPTQYTTPPPQLNSPVREVQMSPGITMVTIIASVGGACCVILIILQILIRRRILQKKALRPVVFGQRASLQSLDHVALGVIPKSRPNSGYWNPALEQEEIPEPSSQSHLVNFAGLANFSLDKNGIYEEFQMIPFETPEKSEVPINVEEKNRFANVLPFKTTRVRLEKKEGVDSSDYINANYIKGYMKTEKSYIATQSPMINTAEDFWRMVWEQQSKVILMLNPLNDSGKPKMCTMYWPDGEGSECVKQYGDYAITLMKKDVQQDYIETTLQLRDMERNLKREIHHFWFQTWPETGQPEPLAFVKFILDTRPRYEDTGTPLVVHCGPGTGRTGVLIAVDSCMRMFEAKRRVDVLHCVHQMRKERAGSVQTRDQYMLIYQALNEYAVILSSPSMSTRSSVITLHAML